MIQEEIVSAKTENLPFRLYYGRIHQHLEIANKKRDIPPHREYPFWSIHKSELFYFDYNGFGGGGFLYK